ncbi:MAG: hypothetical protein ACP5NX_04290 [Candidatus Bilamarchaeaceae archaeon]
MSIQSKQPGSGRFMQAVKAVADKTARAAFIAAVPLVASLCAYSCGTDTAGKPGSEAEQAETEPSCKASVSSKTYKFAETYLWTKTGMATTKTKVCEGSGDFVEETTTADNANAPFLVINPDREFKPSESGFEPRVLANLYFSGGVSLILQGRMEMLADIPMRFDPVPNVVSGEYDNAVILFKTMTDVQEFKGDSKVFELGKVVYADRYELTVSKICKEYDPWNDLLADMLLFGSVRDLKTGESADVMAAIPTVQPLIVTFSDASILIIMRKAYVESQNPNYGKDYCGHDEPGFAPEDYAELAFALPGKEIMAMETGPDAKYWDMFTVREFSIPVKDGQTATDGDTEK